MLPTPLGGLFLQSPAIRGTNMGSCSIHPPLKGGLNDTKTMKRLTKIPQQHLMWDTHVDMQVTGGGGVGGAYNWVLTEEAIQLKYEQPGKKTWSQQNIGIKHEDRWCNQVYVTQFYSLFITDDGSSSTEVPNTITKSCTVSRRPAPLALILRCHVKLFTTCLQSLLLCTYEETVRVHVTSWQNDAAVKLLSYDVSFSCRENDGCSFYTWTSEFFHSLLKEYSRIFFGFLPHLIWSKFHFAHLQG